MTALQAKATAERWKIANDDEDYVYPRFAQAFGEPIDREHTPHLIPLLNRVERDVSRPVFAAKDHFRWLRPYQRIQLTRVCGEAVPPAPDLNADERSSYPSGHSAYGWAAALAVWSRLRLSTKLRCSREATTTASAVSSAVCISRAI